MGRVEAPVVVERLDHSQFRFDSCLLQDDPDPTTKAQSAGGRVESQHVDIARVTRSIAFEYLDACRLACTVWPQKSETLTGAHFEVHAGQCLDIAIALEQASDSDSRTRSHTDTSRFLDPRVRTVPTLPENSKRIAGPSQRLRSIAVWPGFRQRNRRLIFRTQDRPSCRSPLQAPCHL